MTKPKSWHFAAYSLNVGGWYQAISSHFTPEQVSHDICDRAFGLNGFSQYSITFIEDGVIEMAELPHQQYRFRWYGPGKTI